MNLPKILKEQGYSIVKIGETWETWEHGEYRVLVGIESSTLIVKHYSQGSLDYMTEFHNYHNQSSNVLNAITQIKDVA